MLKKIIGFCLLTIYSFATPTLEEKVGQMLIVHFNGEEANAEAQELINTVQPGGFVFYNWSNGLHSPTQIRNLTNGLNKLSTTPLLFAVDQEGGSVNRCTEGFTVFPGNKVLGVLNKPELAKQSAYAMGLELRAAGINMNFAPVVDVNSIARNPVIGIRSFGSDVNNVIALGRGALEGFSDAGILTTLKHFPGHGNVQIDSHENLPLQNMTLESLRNNDLRPFAELSGFADAVMTAHILVPALDRKNCATLSKNILNLLRNEYNFQGVIISDSLVMKGLLKNANSSIEEAAIKAVDAGCDLLVLGGKQLLDASNFELSVADVQNLHSALVNAVRSGKLTEDRIDQSYERILKLKSKLNRPCPQPNFAYNQNLAANTAYEALAFYKHRRLPKSMSECRISVVAPEALRESLSKTSFAKECEIQYVSTLPNQKEFAKAHILAGKTDILVVFSLNAWQSEKQMTFIKTLLHRDNTYTVFVPAKDSLDATLQTKSGTTIISYGPSSTSLEAVYRKIKSM